MRISFWLCGESWSIDLCHKLWEALVYVKATDTNSSHYLLKSCILCAQHWPVFFLLVTEIKCNTKYPREGGMKEIQLDRLNASFKGPE